MSGGGFVCWKCGTGIGREPLPLSRTAHCASCMADLHACRMCSFFDIRVAKSCREPVAEDVLDKGRANFCGYFQLKAGSYVPGTDSSRARAELGALFGGGPVKEDASPEEARKQLDALFGDKRGKKGK